jgi:pimeloyl-ACP methyl ester carboxylesterase
VEPEAKGSQGYFESMIKKIGVLILGLLIIGAVILFAWYQIDGQPLPETDQFLTGAGYAVTSSDDGGFIFTPEESNGHGLLIMHGALIKPKSYVKTAAFFAQRGYTVFIPNGLARLSINAVDGAAERMKAFDVQDWFFIGHSMGGFSTLTLISRHQPKVRAVALWAASQPSDFSGLTMPILFLWGDNDGLLPAGRFAEGKANLPATVEYVTVPGGNHQDFAMYSHQYFDNEGRLGWRAQIDLANEKTAEFFGGLL